MRKGEHTRQEILRKAAPIFNRRGYARAALSDLMKATGLQKGGIYRHFESKQQLAAEAFDYAWKEVLNARFEGLDKIANSVDRLKQLVANFVERRGIVGGGCPLLNTATDNDDGDPLLRERARAALRSWRTDVAATVTSGMKKKEIRPEVEASEVANVLIAALEGATMLSYLEGDSAPLRRVQKHLDDYLESKVRRAPASRQSKRRAVG